MGFRVLAAALVALSAGAATGSAPADRRVTAPAAVTGLGQSGRVVAFAAGPTGTDCDSVREWLVATRAVVRLGRSRPCGDAVSTGRGIVGPVVSGSRTLWLSYAGGNIREWALLTATPTARTPRRLALVAADVDGPAPIVIGDGSPTALPYAIGSTITVLAPSGARRARFDVGAPVRLLAAGAGRVAAALATGRVVVHREDGTFVEGLDYAPGDPTAIRLGVRGVLVQVGSRVDVRLGGATTTVLLPSGARLLDAAQDVLLYASGPDLRGRRLSSGRDALLAAPGRPRPGRTMLAQLEPQGLSYASGAHVVYRPWVRLAAALASP